MKGVIFDRDGVILDSESTNINSAVQTFQKLGINIKEEEKERIVGRHPDDYKDFFKEKYSFSYDEFREIQKDIYLELLDSTPLFTETVSLIKKLYEQKIPLALTTSSELNSTLKILKRADLENAFNVITTAEDCKERKPSGMPYLITSQKMNLEPQDCVVIEDSPVGIEAAKNAGMKCIAVPNRHTQNQDFSGADIVVESADKIDMKLLTEI